MKEWSDEELDKLFRKSAGEFEPPFEPDDWTELRHRLDDADQVAGGDWLGQARPWTLALLLLMIIGGISVYYGSSKMGEKRDTILSASDKYSPGSSAQTKPLAGRTNSSGATKKGGAEASLPENQKAAGTGFEESTTEVIQRRESTDIRKKTNQREDIKELPRSLANVSGVRKQTDLRNQEGGEGAILLPKEKNSVNTGQKDFPQRPHPNADRLNAADRSNEAREKEAVPPRIGTDSERAVSGEPGGPGAQSSLPALERLHNRHTTLIKSGLSLPAVVYQPVADSTFKSPTIKVPKWTVRIGVSPDMSFVNMNMKNMARPSPAASLLAEYSIARRWAIQAGVIRSLKTYNAQAGAYEWPSSWYQKQMPVSVNGSCQVFELPLNVRYDFRLREKERWFTGAGVSSYKMQKEKYVYNYKTYDPNIRWWKWEGQTGWYLFSHANASIGYERLLTSKLSIMAEPYIRIPLRRVGFGKVNLFSTGVWFSLRYAPSFRK